MGLLTQNPRAALVLASLLALLWYGLSGGVGWLFAVPAILVSVLLTLRLTQVQIRSLSWLGLLQYTGFFLRQSLLGALDVAWRAFHPALPLEICTHRHRLELPEGQPRSLFVATLSLLPGTLSMDFDGTDIQVHSIAGDPTLAIKRLETRVAALFPDKRSEGSP